MSDVKQSPALPASRPTDAKSVLQLDWGSTVIDDALMPAPPSFGPRGTRGDGSSRKRVAMFRADARRAFSDLDTGLLKNLSPDDVRHRLRHNVYVFRIYDKPLAHRELLKTRLSQKASLEDVYWAWFALSKEELRLIETQLLGTVMINEHQSNDDPDSPPSSDGHPYMTLGEIVAVEYAGDGSVDVSIRLYESPWGMWACRKIEAGLMRGISLHTVRVGDNITVREVSLCFMGKRPGTRLQRIKTLATPAPLKRTSVPYVTPPDFPYAKLHKLADMLALSDLSSGQKKIRALLDDDTYDPVSCCDSLADDEFLVDGRVVFAPDLSALDDEEIVKILSDDPDELTALLLIVPPDDLTTAERKTAMASALTGGAPIPDSGAAAAAAAAAAPPSGGAPLAAGVPTGGATSMPIDSTKSSAAPVGGQPPSQPQSTSTGGIGSSSAPTGAAGIPSSAGGAAPMDLSGVGAGTGTGTGTGAASSSKTDATGAGGTRRDADAAGLTDASMMSHRPTKMARGAGGEKLSEPTSQDLRQYHESLQTLDALQSQLDRAEDFYKKLPAELQPQYLHVIDGFKTQVNEHRRKNEWLISERDTAKRDAARENAAVINDLNNMAKYLVATSLSDEEEKLLDELKTLPPETDMTKFLRKFGPIASKASYSVDVRKTSRDHRKITQMTADVAASMNGADGKTAAPAIAAAASATAGGAAAAAAPPAPSTPAPAAASAPAPAAAMQTPAATAPQPTPTTVPPATAAAATAPPAAAAPPQTDGFMSKFAGITDQDIQNYMAHKAQQAQATAQSIRNNFGSQPIAAAASTTAGRGVALSDVFKAGSTAPITAAPTPAVALHHQTAPPAPGSAGGVFSASSGFQPMINLAYVSGDQSKYSKLFVADDS